ncbi:galactose-specific lectin nattectin-like [Mugil cephalus]|uniref:galactose-specific lectin nattectin-like n=1 Tax=Mugil cephalus TaxID=48193 RepID=UPI001FB5E1DB|nr:galactose-specific lectin nattectin-like [Mugil cephalus]
MSGSLKLEISIISAMKTLPLIVFVCVVMTLTGADAKSRLIKRSTNCPGWSEYNGRCFIFISTNLTWAKAEIHCQSLGGNIASVHNIFEYHAIQYLIQNGSHDHPETWIGGSDAEENGVWLWSDGTRFHYTNWCDGEPSTTQGQQNCIQMNYGASKCWDDVQCNVRRPSVCSKKIQ